jgi:hypothetical protein
MKYWEKTLLQCSFGHHKSLHVLVWGWTCASIAQRLAGNHMNHGRASWFLSNMVTCLPNYTMPHPRRL